MNLIVMRNMNRIFILFHYCNNWEYYESSINRLKIALKVLNKDYLFPNSSLIHFNQVSWSISRKITYAFHVLDKLLVFTIFNAK